MAIHIYLLWTYKGISVKEHLTSCNRTGKHFMGAIGRLYIHFYYKTDYSVFVFTLIICVPKYTVILGT